MRKIRLFNNHSEYVAFTSTTEYILPNISKCALTYDIHINPYVRPKDTIMITATFNVNDTSSPTRILGINSLTSIYSIYVDGIRFPNPMNGYLFDTIGEHTVEYSLVNATTTIANMFSGCSMLSSVVVESSVTSIADGTFNGCSLLSSITFNGNVSSIGSSAFTLCTSISNFLVPQSVTSISNYSFYRCSSLVNVSLHNEITSIGQSAFEGCTSLSGINIYSGITQIGNSAFSGCSSLEEIRVSGNTPASLGNAAFDSTNDCPIIIKNCAYVDVYQNAWSSYSSRIDCPLQEYLEVTYLVTSTTMSTKLMDNRNGMSWISEMFVDDMQITPTSAYTFSQTGPHTVKYKLGSTKTIPNMCFSYSFIFTYISDVVFPSDLVDLGGNGGDKMFFNQSSLSSVTFPRVCSLKHIRRGCFNACSSLSSVTFSDGLETIGEQCFNNCNNIRDVVLPSSMQSISGTFFNNACSVVNSLTLLGSEPPLLVANAFTNGINTFPIYVPSNAVTAYKTATNWSEYENQITPIP